MKQTAVEWLVEQFKIPNSDSYISETFKQALELEKQQIIEAYRDGRTDQQTKDGFYNRNSETYYNETFKKP